MTDWKPEYSEILKTKLKQSKMFQKPEDSKRMKVTKERELSFEGLLSRIKGQIEEVNSIIPIENCTPEDLDRLFYELGGGQSRRRSDRILSRLDGGWNEFINICKNLLNKA